MILIIWYRDTKSRYMIIEMHVETMRLGSIVSVLIIRYVILRYVPIFVLADYVHVYEGGEHNLIKQYNFHAVILYRQGRTMLKFQLLWKLTFTQVPIYNHTNTDIHKRIPIYIENDA